jgi:hypothetical protein
MTVVSHVVRTDKPAEQDKKRSPAAPRRRRVGTAKAESVRVFFRPRGMR